MPTTPEYDAAVQRNLDKLRGNISSVKMTPSETAKEIAEIQGGAKSSFEAEAVSIDRIPTQMSPALTGISEGITGTFSIEIPAKKKRGRPLGSKNKPKAPE